MITLDTDSAQEFLARVVPWDGQSFVSIHHSFPVQNPRNPARPFGMSGTSNRDLAGAMRTLKYIATRPDTRDIYVCMSSLRSAVEKTKGRARWFQSDKHADNAVALKSLFVDVDVKPGAYATTRDGVGALVRFCKAIDLPLPTGMVESGSGGFHAYWVLSRPLAVAEWQPLALALAEATRTNGLICDTQCTVDSVRILRVPGTANFKHSPERPVIMRPFLPDDYSPERIERALRPFIGKASPSLAPVRAALPRRDAPTDPSLLTELSAGVEVNTAPPARLADLGAQCPFIATALATGGRDYANPLWNLTTLLATFCVEEEQAAHQMACGHAEYTVESTSELYARKKQEREARDLGWPKCRAVSDAGFPGCAACPHFPDGKSPLNFSRPAPVTPPVTPATAQAGAVQPGIPAADIALPAEYERGADGMVYLLQGDDQGNTRRIPVFPRTIREPWVQRHPWILHWTSEGFGNEPEQNIRIPFEAFATKDRLMRELTVQSLVLTENTFRLFQRFVMSWMEQLQQHAVAVIDSQPFGWVRSSGKSCFVYGGRVWGPGFDLPAASADPVTVRQYQPTGDLAPWIEAAKMTTDQKRPGLDAILASAFAAPLVKFTGQTGLMMSVWSSESGIGKSTTIKIAQAVWGNPKFSESLDATLNSVLNKIGTLRHLPMYWDELRGKGFERFAELAFKLTQGTEKSRLSSDATQRERGTWQTLLVSASNASVIDLVAQQSKTTTAGVHRAFEYRLTRGVTGRMGIADASRMVDRLEEHYGVVGLAYARWLGANAARVDKNIEALAKWVEKQLEPREDERFWTATITVLLQGAIYGNTLGFTEIDVDGLRELLFGVFRTMRQEVRQEAVDVQRADALTDVIGQYLAHVGQRRTLRTSTMTYGKGSNASAGIKVYSDTTKLDAVLVQVAVDDSVARIAEAQFSDWLREKGYPKKQVMQSLEKYGMVRGRRTLGAGTALQAATQQWCIDIDLEKLEEEA